MHRAGVLALDHLHPVARSADRIELSVCPFCAMLGLLFLVSGFFKQEDHENDQIDHNHGANGVHEAVGVSGNCVELLHEEPRVEW